VRPQLASKIPKDRGLGHRRASRVALPICLAAFFAILALPPLGLFAQPTTTTLRDRVPSSLAKRGLLPVPTPDLSYTDEGVQRALQEAKEHLDAVIAEKKTGPRHLAEAYAYTGLLYHAHRILEPARICYRNAAQLVPNDFRWPYYLGYLYGQIGRLEEARESYETALHLKPDLAVVKLRLGRIYLEQGDLGLAEELFRTCAAARELRGAALFELAQLALAQERFEQAVGLLQQALAEDPHASRIHYMLALAYRGLNDLEKAQQHLRQRGEGEPQIRDPLIEGLERLSVGQRTVFHTGLSAVRREEYDLAVRLFREGLDRDPDNLDARVSLARALYLSGNRKAAAEQLAEVLDRAPGHPLATFLRGVLYEEAGAREEAIAYFRATIDADPAHPGAHFYLANLLMQSGDFAEATHHYALSLRQDPDNVNARVGEMLGRIQAGASPAEIHQRLEEAHSLHPDSPPFIYLLAALLAASPDDDVRDGKRALALAQRLAEPYRMPKDLEILAMAYAECGDFDAAVSAQRDAVGNAIGFNRMDLLPRLMENLARFQSHKPSRSPWPASGPLLDLPPIDAFGAFADYPTDTPY
jgi:tetratricopeptide (TPR) repeat protein